MQSVSFCQLLRGKSIQRRSLSRLASSKQSAQAPSGPDQQYSWLFTFSRNPNVPRIRLTSSRDIPVLSLSKFDLVTPLVGGRKTAKPCSPKTRIARKSTSRIAGLPLNIH